MSKETNSIDYVEFPAATAQDIAEAKRFYGEVFAWSFNEWGDTYTDTASSGLTSGFNADPDHRLDKPLVVVYAKDLEAARAKILAAGGKITRDIFSFPGGRRFHFTDTIGNELAAWSDH